ncbi:MAG TPA: hypothetical protein DCL35_01295 [Candidatus Omnitrophica bacterium]|nr:hypothetical protein [Candidatus Omnitrophota bacterium]
MIVPMKKVSLVCLAREAEGVVAKLRSLNVLHIEHQQMPQGPGISFLREDINLVKDALNVLSEKEFLGKPCQQKHEARDDWRTIARRIVDSRKRLDQLEEYSRVLRNRVVEWRHWGDFDPAQVQALAKKNIFVRLYQIPQKEVADLGPDVVTSVISTQAGTAYCCVISRQQVELPFKEVSLPHISLTNMGMRLMEDRETIQNIREDIRKWICYRDSFGGIRQKIEKDLEFHEAVCGMGQAGQLAYLAGYIPFDARNQLLDTAEKEKWGIVIADPLPEDKVPTLIRNPRWVSIINPVFKLIEVVPGYKELDISLWFLVFLSIFFGMLIGDAGYGAIFFALTLWAHRKNGRSVRDEGPFYLLYLFSGCTILWGVLTATYFGQEWLPAAVRPLVPALRNDRNLQGICFLLGAIHLSIGHGWRALLKWPALNALADIGWVVILWGAFFLARVLILGEAMRPFVPWFFIAGSALVVFFTEPKKNVLRSIGPGLGNLLLNLVNSFTDIVSYIRLFAVGLATVAIADAFNKMAADVGFNSFVSGLLAAFVILLGHVLNIVLGPMSVLVHGVRLNVLEFCGHADIKWSGFAYRPLHEERRKDEKITKGE